MRDIKKKRIDAELVRTISEILQNEARDELMHTITITGADVSDDLSYAKIYFRSLSSMEPKELESEMEEASDFIRRYVAEEMNLRMTPKLKFIYDNSIDYGKNIDRIIENIHEKKE